MTERFHRSPTMSHVSGIDQEPWIALFDEERKDSSEGTYEDALGNLVKGFLLSDDDDMASNTAQRIQNYYEQEYLLADPLMKFEDDQGMGEFLAAFYNIIFLLARLIPYNSYAQQKLLLLVLELRKLPPKSFKIWQVCELSPALPLLFTGFDVVAQEECLVWSREPVSAVLIEDNWNGNCRTLKMNLSRGVDSL